MINLSLSDPHDNTKYFVRIWDSNLENLNDSQHANY